MSPATDAERPTALVTGAATGIGAATALALAQQGWDLVLHHHRSDPDVVVRQAQAAGAHVEVRQADLADPQAAWGLIQEGDHFDAIVHNAAIYERRTLQDMDGDAWRHTMAVDLDAPAALTQAALPALAPEASVVFVSSVVAARGSRHGPHYAAAKAGLVGLMRSLALELAPHRVNAVLPGYIDTDMIAGDSPDKRRHRADEVPLGRVGRPEEIAQVIGFLCGPGASYVTGQAWHVNGGLHAG